MSEPFHIDKVPEGMFPINFIIVYQYTCVVTGLMDKLKSAKYKHNCFHARRNNNLNLLMCENRFLFRQKYKDT